MGRQTSLRRILILSLACMAGGLLPAWVTTATAQVRPVLATRHVVDPTDPTLVGEESQLLIETFCMCIVHGVEPCTKEMRLMSEAAISPDPCPGGAQPGPDVRCGHRLSEHSPSNPFEAPSAFDVVGYLWDDRNPAFRTFILPRVSRREFPRGTHSYFFTYQAGQVTGDVVLHGRWSELEPFHQFLGRDEHPDGCDVMTPDRQVCEKQAYISVTVRGLQELPPPGIRDTASGVWMPYVRCGDSGNCALTADTAYTDQHHPTVHWARPDLWAALECLAELWGLECSEGPPVGQVVPVTLAILDISLPRGGLLDIQGNWNLRGPHYRHRHGTDADLDNASLAGRCAGKSWQEVLWTPTPEFGNRRMGELCSLTYPIYRDGRPDYNHVCPGQDNRCF